jgi:hypothetical protein
MLQTKAKGPVAVEMPLGAERWDLGSGNLLPNGEPSRVPNAHAVCCPRGAARKRGRDLSDEAVTLLVDDRGPERQGLG